LRRNATQRLIAEGGRRWIRDRRAGRPGVWTARAMQGPIRPQPLSLCQLSTSIYPPRSHGGPTGNILR
jgi:hypothetical protein